MAPLPHVGTWPKGIYNPLVGYYFLQTRGFLHSLRAREQLSTLFSLCLRLTASLTFAIHTGQRPLTHPLRSPVVCFFVQEIPFLILPAFLFYVLQLFSASVASSLT